MPGVLAERLDAIDYQGPPWSERYPELVHIREDRFTEPVDNVVRRNIFFQRDTLYNISRVPTAVRDMDAWHTERGAFSCDIAGYAVESP